jgi:chromosome partitioning protein
MRTVAVAGRKGGTGKTTTAVNVAGWLATQGHRVLLIDLDPQGNATTSLGIQTEGADVWRLLVRQDPLQGMIIKARPGLMLLAGGEKTAVARDMIGVQATRDSRASISTLHQALAPASGYDFTLIDCPPSLDLLTINALVAADEIALPVPCQFLGAMGAKQFVELAAELAGAGGHAVLTYVIPTFYRQNTRQSIEIVSALKQAFGNKVTESIRLTVRLDEAVGNGQTIFEYDPTGNGAIDYEAVARRIADG